MAQPVLYAFGQRHPDARQRNWKQAPCASRIHLTWRNKLGAVLFTTTTSGTVGVEVNWTFATNDVDIYLTRGNDPCTEETFNNRSCGFIATAESPSVKPERLTVPNLAAGTYTLYVANFGDTDESVAWQVTLTSTSASSVSSATTASVQRGAAKGTLNRILELR